MINESIKDLIQNCLLPELKENFDSALINKECFKSYHECLLVQLPVIFDWMHEQEKWLFSSKENDHEKQDIQGQLIILLSELSGLSSYEAIYNLDSNSQLLTHVERLLNRFEIRMSPKAEEIIFNYYKDKLHKDKWKRNLGTIHGFTRYLEHRFQGSFGMTQLFLNFSLAVALNVRTCHESHYKYLSTKIFHTMLDQGNANDIRKTNIHSVIYDAALKDIYIMDSLVFVKSLWNCLLKCLNFYSEIDSFTWSQVDDLLEVLIRNVTLAPDSSTSLQLTTFINRLMVYFAINNRELEEKLKTDLTKVNCLKDCRVLFSQNTSYTCYRWAKSILQMFILESHKLKQSPDTSLKLLNELHHCYLVTIFPINLCVIESHLVEFMEKFNIIIMEVVRIQKENETVLKAITDLLETFYLHLENCSKSSKLLKYKNAYCELFKHPPFLSYVSVI
ncbi:uncharacterized protein ACN427_006800 isoform 2-T2 [Glossina fuscipes fuscipes]